MLMLLLMMLAAADGAYDGTPVPDPELAGQRGGFALPNGIDVALTVQTQTTLNGAIVLRTVFRADQGPSTLTAYAPRTGETVLAPTGAAEAGSAATRMPTISYDARTGISIAPGATAPGFAIATAAQGADAVPAGLVQVAAGAVTDNGTIVQADRPGPQSVELRGSDLSISHLIGNAFGSAIANSGSDRAIDTQTVVSIDLRNAGPDVLGSSMLRVQDIATDALRLRQ